MAMHGIPPTHYDAARYHAAQYDTAQFEALRELTSLLTESSPSSPCAVGVSGLGSGTVELAVKPLEGDDVVRALAGFRARESWQAFGILAPGRAQSLDDHRPPRPVVVAVFADRQGNCTDALRGFDRAATVPGGGEGRMLDACRRVLDLPTPPPEHEPALWFAFEWLDRALAATLAADLGDPPDWPTLRALDPGRDCAGLTWADLRQWCAGGIVVVPGVEPHAAAWMDDGMFSREAIAAYPPLLDLTDDLEQLLAHATYQQLIDAIAEQMRDQ